MKLPTKILAGVLFLSLLPFLPASVQGARGDEAASKENLDLPLNALGTDEDEEDAPEIVNFYTLQLEGDGFFYVVDKSGSMNNAGELAIAKREITKNITEFTDRVQFGVFLFSSNVAKFPSSGQAAEASSSMKSAAISWIQSQQSTPGSCVQAGLSAALQMANTCTAKRKVITYVGDGGGTCNGANEAEYLQQTLAAVTAQNFQRIQINCIGVLSYPKLNEDFMKNLAAMNGGTYTRIQ